MALFAGVSVFAAHIFGYDAETNALNNKVTFQQSAGDWDANGLDR